MVDKKVIWWIMEVICTRVSSGDSYASKKGGGLEARSSGYGSGGGHGGGGGYGYQPQV